MENNINQICQLFHSDEQEIRRDFKLLFEKVSSKRALSPRVFDHTHFPITAYVDDKLLDESELFNLINPQISSTGSRCMIILGSTGIGKSELCAYFRKELKKLDLDKYVLYLDKSATLYDIVTDRLPNFYYQATGKKLSDFQSEGFKNLRYANLAAKSVMIHMLNKLNIRLLQIFEDDWKIQRDFQDQLAKGIKKIFQKDAEDIETKGLNLFDSALISECTSEGWMRTIRNYFPDEDEDKIANRLNEAFSHAIYSSSGIPSFSSLLKKIARKINKKIWIVFEDYDLPYLDNKEILSFAESDQTEIDVQFVIALVHDRWENLKKMLSGTFIERATFVEFGEGSSNFLNSDSCLEFIKPFLSYHKKYYSTYCDNCKRCPNNIIGTFPMSELFLKRVFNGLSKDEQKPRKYVELVGSFLGDFIDKEIYPFDNKHLLGKIHIIDILPDVEEGFESLFHWYFAIEDDSSIKNYCEIFGIENKKDYKPQPKKKPEKDPKTGIIDEKFNNLQSQIRNYLENPSNERWKECGHTIQYGLIKVLEFLTHKHLIRPSWSSKSSPNIVYNFPGKGNILSIQRKKNVLSYEFNPLLMPMNVGEELLKIGYDKTPDNQFQESLSTETIQFVTPIIYNWRKQVEGYYLTQQFGDNSEDFIKLCLLCYRLIEDFENPFKNQILKQFNGFESFEEQYLQELTEKLSQFIEDRTYIEDLVKWNYSVGGDLYRFKINLIENPWQELNNFKKSKVGKILDGNLRYKQSGSKVELASILRDIFNFSKSLTEKKYTKAIKEIPANETIHFISNITENNIKNIVTAADLSTLDGKKIKTNLRELSTFNYEKYNSLRGNLKIFSEEKHDGLKTIQALYLRNDKLYNSLKQILTDDIYCNSKDDGHFTLAAFCEFLIEQSKNEKNQKLEKELKISQNELKIILNNINILRSKKEVKLEKIEQEIDSIENLDEIKDMIKKYNSSWTNYITQESENIENLKELNNILKQFDNEKIEITINSLNNFIKTPSIDKIQDYITSRNHLQDDLKGIMPNLGTEKAIKLLKGQKIPFSQLSEKEINDIFNSELKKIVSLILGKE